MYLGLAALGAISTSRPAVAIAWISLTLTGLAAAAPVAWSLPSLIAPIGGAGGVGGIMNFANNLMGVAASIVTGYIVAATRSFAGALVTAGAVLVIRMIVFVALLGHIESLPGP